MDNNSTLEITQEIGVYGITASSVGGRNCEQYTFIVFVSLIFTLCLVGLVATSFSLAVVCREKDKSSATGFLLICLATTDIMVLVCWTLVQVPSSLIYLTRIKSVSDIFHEHGAFIMFWVEPLCTMTHNMATWLVVMITWQRYVAVCMPYKVHIFGSVRVARIQAAVAFVGSFFLTLPQFLEREIIVLGNTSMLSEKPFARTDSYAKFYKLGFYCVVIYVIPLSCLLFMTIRLLQTLKKTTQKRQQMTSQRKYNQDLTFTLVIVVIIFIFCQLVTPVKRILEVFKQVDYLNEEEQCRGFLYYFTPWVTVAVIFNSTVDCFIFIFTQHRFRKGLIIILRCNKLNKVKPELEQTAEISTLGMQSLQT